MLAFPINRACKTTFLLAGSGSSIGAKLTGGPVQGLCHLLAEPLCRLAWGLCHVDSATTTDFLARVSRADS